MIYKYFNTALIIRTLVIVLAAIGGTISYLEANWILLAVCGLIIVILTANTIHYFNTINRKLSYFFEAVRNEDSSLHFPDYVKQPYVKNLHISLNNVNEVLSEIKIRNEHKEHFFKEFMKHSSTGLMAVDEKGYIEIINKTALRLLNAPILIHIERIKQLNQAFYDALLALGNNQSKTIKILVRNELHVVMIKMVKLKFSEKDFRIYSLSDIKTELDEKEMETWQKMIRILTHEIMNSITPISSISSTLSNYFNNGKSVNERSLENIAHGLGVIHERSKGLTHFVENYRKLTKVPKPVFAKIVIDDWLNAVRILFEERESKDQISLIIKNRYPKKSFLGDQKLLTQVVINLLNNSADALINTKEKKLTIDVSESPKGSFNIKFIDNGPGITPENLEQIFMPFFTTKENGSGIGLSLSRQIMKLHKGELMARSTPGKETVFEMRI
ncbi:unnamed protein product [Chrysoparadoxa australica]